MTSSGPTLNTAWILSSPYTSAEQRFGVEDEEVFRQRLENFNHLKAAENRLRALALDYYPAVHHGEGEPTARYHRNSLLALAIETLTDLFLAKGEYNTRPTAHAFHWLSRHEMADFFQNLDGEIIYGGRPGSLAFYLNRFSNLSGFSVFTLIDLALEAFWEEIGASYFYMTPSGRQDYLLEYCTLDSDRLSRWLEAFRIQQQTNIPLLRKLRGLCLSKQMYKELGYRLLLGEYDGSAFSVFELLDPKPAGNSPLQLAETLSNLWPPAGPVLAYAAFTVEGLSKAAQILSSLDVDLLDRPFSSFLQECPDIAHRVALSICLSYDACFILSKYQTWLHAPQILKVLESTILQFLYGERVCSTTLSSRLSHRFWSEASLPLQLTVPKMLPFLPKANEVSTSLATETRAPRFGISLAESNTPNVIPLLTFPIGTQQVIQRHPNAPNHAYEGLPCLSYPEQVESIAQQLSSLKQQGFKAVVLQKGDFNLNEHLCFCQRCRDSFSAFANANQLKIPWPWQEAYDLSAPSFRWYRKFQFMQARAAFYRWRQIGLSLAIKPIQWQQEFAAAGMEAVLLQESFSLPVVLKARRSGCCIYFEQNVTHEQLLTAFAFDVHLVQTTLNETWHTFFQRWGTLFSGYATALYQYSQNYQRLYLGEELVFGSAVPDCALKVFSEDQISKPILVTFMAPLLQGLTLRIKRSLFPYGNLLAWGFTADELVSLDLKESETWVEVDIPATPFPFVFIGGAHARVSFQ